MHYVIVLVIVLAQIYEVHLCVKKLCRSPGHAWF